MVAKTKFAFTFSFALVSCGQLQHSLLILCLQRAKVYIGFMRNIKNAYISSLKAGFKPQAHHLMFNYKIYNFSFGNIYIIKSTYIRVYHFWFMYRNIARISINIFLINYRWWVWTGKVHAHICAEINIIPNYPTKLILTLDFLSSSRELWKLQMSN